MSHRVPERLRRDFALSIIVIMGGVGLFAILPFSAYRFLQGDVVQGAVDLIVALGIMLPAWYAWRGGNVAAVGLWIAGVITSGAVVISAMVTHAGFAWMFPALLVNFFIVRPTIAGLLAIAGIVIVQFIPNAFETSIQRVTMLVTMSLVALLSYIFALRTAMQRRMLEDMATLDMLTGTRNRRAMEAEIAIALASHVRSGRTIMLAILDLDHFKAVNDQFGHEEGDRVLRCFAQVIAKHTRPTDRLFRFGGEEFVLLMEQTDEAGVVRVFANLQQRVRESLHAGGNAITFSMGAAPVQSGESRDSWLARADAALYRAKQEGRDRLVVASSPDSQ